MADPIISVSHLSFSYNSDPVLSNVTFNIQKGEYVGIVGPNGSGKTTLLRLLLGLNKTQQGQIQVGGSIGYIPQKVGNIGIDFPATALEVLASNYQKNSQESLSQALARVVELVELDKFKSKLLSDLSGGQLQRVFIARSLVNNPEILIFDEPTVGVDKKNQTNFYHFLKRINTEFGVTILFVTHDIEMISEQATKVLRIDEGVLVSFET